MLKKLQISYHTLERLLKLPVGVIIVGVKEGSDHAIAELILADQYQKLPHDCTLDFENMTWNPSEAT